LRGLPRFITVVMGGEVMEGEGAPGGGQTLRPAARSPPPLPPGRQPELSARSAACVNITVTICPLGVAPIAEPGPCPCVAPGWWLQGLRTSTTALRPASLQPLSAKTGVGNVGGKLENLPTLSRIRISTCRWKNPSTSMCAAITPERSHFCWVPEVAIPCLGPASHA